MEKIMKAIQAKEITMIVIIKEIIKENITIIKKNITAKVKMTKTKGITKTIKEAEENTIRTIIIQAVTEKIITKIMINMINTITKIMTTKIRVTKENTMTMTTIMTKAIKKATRNMIIMIKKTSNLITKKMTVMKINLTKKMIMEINLTEKMIMEINLTKKMKAMKINLTKKMKAMEITNSITEIKNSGIAIIMIIMGKKMVIKAKKISRTLKQMITIKKRRKVSGPLTKKKIFLM